MKLLLVEDDLGLTAQLVDNLERVGHRVETVTNGADGLHSIREFPYDLAIVDIGLPVISGVELIECARRDNVDTPILVLTARSRWQDKVEGLNAGADDYLVKPFQFEELEARIIAMSRRAGGYASNVLCYGCFRLELDSQEFYVNEKLVSLTGFEYSLMDFFLRNPKRVHSKQVLAEYLYSEDTDPDSNVIEVIVGRLRKKIDPDNLLKPITTVRGRGYRFALSNMD